MKNIFYYIERINVHLYTVLKRHMFGYWGKNSLISPYAIDITGAKNIIIGERTCFLTGLRISTWEKGKIKIGNNCSFGILNHISSALYIKIGDGVLTGSNVLITDNSHGEITKKDLSLPPLKRRLYCKGEVVIEDNVWIGQNACILSGVVLGKGCVIGANSVVTHNVPSYAVVGGAPAHIIKQLDAGMQND